MQKQLVVIGGGAAGFFCAVNAARLNPQLHVMLVEKTSKLLAKVRISGGGRCNVTHALFDIVDMSKRYPRGQNFVKKTFHQFFTTDTIMWFEERGVALKAEKDGRMFPVTDSSQTIIDCLLQEARMHNVEIKTNFEVKRIEQEQDGFQIQSNQPKEIKADYIVLATGGYPKAAMFNWLQNLNHTFSSPVPSLFTFNLPKHPITALMGVSVEHVRVKIEGLKLVEEGPLLITHWGKSGPAVLKLSAWGARELSDRNYTFKVHINWLPHYNEQSLKELFIQLRAKQPTKKIVHYNLENLPTRLWQFLVQQAGVKDDIRFADLPSKIENAIIKNTVDYVVEVEGKTTFKEEFVTSGGITLSEVDANTMMSKKLQKLSLPVKY